MKRSWDIDRDCNAVGVPGIPQIGFAPWLVAYLVIVVPFVFIVKWLLRIH